MDLLDVANLQLISSDTNILRYRTLFVNIG